MDLLLRGVREQTREEETDAGAVSKEKGKIYRFESRAAPITRSVVAKGLRKELVVELYPSVVYVFTAGEKDGTTLYLGTRC